jgi:hypothetical protein
LPSDENRSHFVLTYGTHHRGGPWWRRWACAWWAAGRPAAVAALVVGLLAYALGPREYTATVTVQLQPTPPPRIIYAVPSPPAANVLAQRARSGALLDEVLRSPQWATATKASPGTVPQNPIDADVIAGTSMVRLYFTASDRRVACVGADAAAAALAMEAPEDGGERVALLGRMRMAIAEELDAERQRRLATPVSRLTSGRDREAALAAKLQEINARLTQLELERSHTPRARPGAHSAVASLFATNQMELLAAGARAAALTLPVAFIVALVWRWQFWRHATAQQPRTAATAGGPCAADT